MDMHPGARARLEAHLALSSQVISAQFEAVVSDTLKNIISIAWQSHAGEYHEYFHLWIALL